MLIVLVLASVVLVAFYNFHWKRRKLPPGPTPWPLLGNLLSVAKDKSGYRQFRKWADQFGPVFTVWWAEEPYILIADYELMKDAYVKNGDAFSGRHMLPISDILSAANHSAGVARINGEHWKELRRFSMKLLRDLGVGRNGMQERILPTVKAIMRKLDTDLSNGVSEFNMLPLLNFFTANVINELTFATGFDGSHHEHYQQLMHLSETIHSNFTSLPGVMLALMPFLRHVPLFKHTYNKMNGPWEAFHTYFESGIQQRIAYREQMNGVRRLSVLRSRTGSISSAMRKRSGSGGNREQAELQRRKTSGAHRRKTSGEKPIISSILKSQQPSPVEAADLDSAPAVFQQPVRKFSSAAVGRKVSRVQWTVVVEREQSPSECFVDLFLDRLDQLGQDKFLNMDSLRGMCFDLFVGGQEPTASTLGFMIIYLLLDQQRQRKLHAEFDAFAGEQGWTGEWEEDEWIELADRPKLPYMNAVINETQRIANLLPMNLTHMTTQDTHVGDYPIPKGIAVVAQMSCLFCDPKLFPEPEKFIPERFIDENGQLRKCDELIPFSLGKRNCIGEGLARAELFLFAANFFNRFRVLPADPLRPPSIEKKVYFTSMPFPFRCCLVRRRHPPSQGGAADFESRLLCASSSSSSLHAADEEVPVFPVLPAQQQPQAEADTLEKENDKKLALDKEDEEEEDVEDEELAMDAKGDKKKKAFKQRKNGIYQQQQHPQQLISSWEAKQRN